MPFQHLGEASFTFLGVKNILLVGVGMVTEKIRSDPNWRMWASIVAVCGPILLFVSWSHSNMIEQIDLRIRPLTILVNENTKARDAGERYTFGMSQDDKTQNRLEHNRCGKRIDKIEELLNGDSRFHDQGEKIEMRILRLEDKVFIGSN